MRPESREPEEVGFLEGKGAQRFAWVPTSKTNKILNSPTEKIPLGIHTEHSNYYELSPLSTIPNCFRIIPCTFARFLKLGCGCPLKSMLISHALTPWKRQAVHHICPT